MPRRQQMSWSSAVIADRCTMHSAAVPGWWTKPREGTTTRTPCGTSLVMGRVPLITPTATMSVLSCCGPKQPSMSATSARGTVGWSNERGVVSESGAASREQQKKGRLRQQSQRGSNTTNMTPDFYSP